MNGSRAIEVIGGSIFKDPPISKRAGPGGTVMDKAPPCAATKLTSPLMPGASPTPIAHLISSNIQKPTTSRSETPAASRKPSKAARFCSVLSERTRSMLHAPRDGALSLATAVPPAVPAEEDASGAPHDPQNSFCGSFSVPQFVHCSLGCEESCKSYSPPHRE